ncbi:MAG TPA: NTP transferase domain-containing protein [Vicinamibacterales bacterium]|jgi:molybdopterin-guanine dinucleotide biosynthesis protein A|nr:NTP transferase domain-containing protein [Vicinamibacterales bacterium]
MRSAAILAGGHASRFGGRDKAALVIDGQTILARQVAELSEVAGLEEILVTEGGYHPLCAVYTAACLEPIACRLAGRRLKVMDLIDEVHTRVVTADELDRFGDRLRLLAVVNTPADYAGLEALHGHKL